MTERTLTKIAAAYIIALALIGAGSMLTLRKARQQVETLRALAAQTIEVADQQTDALLDCRARLEEQGALARAMDEVADIPYANPGANCYDHSKLLQQALAVAGIESSIFVKDDRKHAWLAVWVETNTGRFISPTQSATFPYGDIVEVRDRQLDVVCSR